MTELGRKQLLINGEWRDAAGGRTMPVVNPATEDVIAEVAAAGERRRGRRGVGRARRALTGRGGRCRPASAAG